MKKYRLFVLFVTLGLASVATSENSTSASPACPKTQLGCLSCGDDPLVRICSSAVQGQCYNRFKCVEECECEPKCDFNCRLPTGQESVCPTPKNGCISCPENRRKRICTSNDPDGSDGKQGLCYDRFVACPESCECEPKCNQNCKLPFRAF